MDTHWDLLGFYYKDKILSWSALALWRKEGRVAFKEMRFHFLVISFPPMVDQINPEMFTLWILYFLHLEYHLFGRNMIKCNRGHRGLDILCCVQRGEGGGTYQCNSEPSRVPLISLIQVFNQWFMNFKLLQNSTRLKKKKVRLVYQHLYVQNPVLQEISCLETCNLCFLAAEWHKSCKEVREYSEIFLCTNSGVLAGASLEKCYR